jgi:hypothetical protein
MAHPRELALGTTRAALPFVSSHAHGRRMPRPVPMSSLLSLVASMVSLTGCSVIQVPEARGAHPTARPRAGTATVLFVLAAPGDPPAALQVLPQPVPTLDAPLTTAVDVLDEDGELLGRLQNRTWLELERPPGRHRFYSVPTGWGANCMLGPCPPGDAQIGRLDAELEAGRVYAVWIGSGLRYGMLDVPTECRGYVDVGLGFATIDLAAVRSAGWYEVQRVLEHPGARAMRVAPRGLRHPDAHLVRSAGEGRVGACWDARLSTLESHDGLPSLDWHLSREEPHP